MKPLLKTRYTTRQTTMTHKHSKSTIPYPESARIFNPLLFHVNFDVVSCKFYGLNIGPQHPVLGVLSCIV